MTKIIPEKCKKCAMLSAAQAQELHGNDGDRCWNPKICYSRRSYARHRDRRNLIRSRKRVETDRFKLAGSWWTLENAKAILALRVCRTNQDWDAYWLNLSSISLCAELSLLTTPFEE